MVEKVADAGAGPSNGTGKKTSTDTAVQLRHEPPYWHEHRTHVKERWLGRELLEVMVTNFYQRTSAYYQWAILKGLCKINGEMKPPSYRIQMGDLMTNLVHRHEPAVTAEPIRVIDRDDAEGRLVVVKPGSIPVHAAGRYNKLTLIELLKKELGIETIWTSNRLDRLTSGIMVCSTKKQTAHKLSEDFAMGKVRKAYVCRVRGKFPDEEEEVVCKEPLVQCDRQSGVSVVHAIGKECETIFNRMSYDAETDTSVLYCRPITGRTHQIRAHVQYLGYPIPNDPIYGHPIWKQYPPQMFKDLPMLPDRWKVEPESSLNVYGCEEIDRVSEGLKTFRDEKDDWGRWKDEALFEKKLKEEGHDLVSVAGSNGQSAAEHRLRNNDSAVVEDAIDESEYCSECHVPLTPDVEAEEDLYIYLHAIKYETEDWTYEDELPWWALEDWKTKARVYSGQAAVVDGKKSGTGKEELGPAGRDKSLSKPVVTLPDVKPLLLSNASALPVLTDTPHGPSQCAVMFDVFGGMEDFAAVEIHQKIQAVLPNETVEKPRYCMQTSHVQVEAGLAAQAAMDLYLGGHLHSINKAYIKVGDVQVPTPLLEQLQVERNEKVALQEGINQSKRARMKAKKAGEPLPDITLEGGEEEFKKRTESEETMLDVLRNAWVNLGEARDTALAEWRRARGITKVPTIDDKLAFRGRVDRSGYNLPTLRTTDMEQVVGAVAWHWLNGKGVEEGPWGVRLVKPDLDVVVKLLPGWHDGSDAVPYWRTRMVNLPGSFVYLLRIPPQKEPAHRPIVPGHLNEGGTVLARYRSFTLAAALPVTPSDSLAIWEPCVGTGSIAIELDALLSQQQQVQGQHSNTYRIFASDLFPREIEKAKEISRLCQSSDRLAFSQVDATDLQAVLAFLGGREVLDGIVTDLPWGRRVLNHMTISLLYPALLKVWIEVLKPGGTVVVMTAEQKTFLRALKTHEADVRKKNTDWVFSVEEVSTQGVSAQSPPAMLDEEARAGRLRTVACGYDVSVIFLRKRQLVE